MSAVSSTLNLTGALKGPGGGTLDYAPPAIVNYDVDVAQSFQLALTPTPVLVTLPAGTEWFGVLPPEANVVGIHHKWQNGDSGGKIHPQIGIPALGVDPSNLSFYLWADSALTVTVWSA